MPTLTGCLGWALHLRHVVWTLWGNACARHRGQALRDRWPSRCAMVLAEAELARNVTSTAGPWRSWKGCCRTLQFQPAEVSTEIACCRSNNCWPTWCPLRRAESWQKYTVPNWLPGNLEDLPVLSPQVQYRCGKAVAAWRLVQPYGVAPGLYAPVDGLPRRHGAVETLEKDLCVRHRDLLLHGDHRRDPALHEPRRQSGKSTWGIAGGALA